MKNHVAPPPDGRLLASLAGSILLASLGVSVATVALPTLARTFSAGVQHVQWVVLAYLLAVTTTIVSAGRLGDLCGNRRVLLGGLTLFTVASAACALAPGLDWLIAGRMVQGLGAAILMSLPISMAKGLVARNRLGTAMGLLGTMSAIGTALGPSVGGMLIDGLGWRAPFVLLASGGVLMLAAVMTSVPRSQASQTNRRRMDWAGSAWLSVVLLCFAMTATGGKVGVPVPAWIWLLVGALALAGFIRTEMTVGSPLIPVSLLRERALATALAINLLVGAVMMATLVVGPFYLSFGLGLSNTTTGLVMAAGPVAAALSGVPAGRITDRFGTSRTLLAGLMVATTGLCAFALLPRLIGIPGYVLALILVTPGFQLFLAANNTAVMQAAADSNRGMLSGLLGLSRNLGFMAGASLLPMVFNAILGETGVADSTPRAIEYAFSATFLCAAGGCGIALLAATRKTERGEAQS